MGWHQPITAQVECRQLRNFIIHKWVRDRGVMAAALYQGHETVPLSVAVAQGPARTVRGAVENPPSLA